MDWSQWLYLSVLAVALWAGRPGVDLTAIMTGNVIATILLAADPQAVAIVDLVSGAVLIWGNPRAQIVAILFAGMVAVEVITSRLHIEKAVIYTGTDALAYVQCGVIGGADRGIRRLYRSIRGRWIDRAYRHRAQALAGHHSGVARVSEANGRG